jgi:hypothetical protein
MKLSNKTYDVLKWLSLVALDGIGVFYGALSAIWGLPFGDQILATCSATSLFIGTLLGISALTNKKNNKEG